MLSRLSGIANTVLQELSGDGTDGDMMGPPNPELTQEPDVAFNNGTNEDILERLAHTEQLVVQLKDVIREKDTQLQQKDVILEEERKAADMKMTKLKLQAKARLASLNKRMEEMKAQGGMGLSQEPQSEKLQFPSKCDTSPKEDQMEGFEMLKQKLQEKEELISSLQTQLSQVQAEKAAQCDAPPKEEQMEGFEMLKQKLQEKEELISSLQTQLSQVQAENAAQEVVREKDARFESQVRLHEDELLQLVTQKEMETEMQQNLRTLHRKLEEQEEALLGRAQVVDLLQQELSAAEQKNQVLSEQLQQLEAEQNTLKTILETERQESKSLIEKMELEVAERKLSLHSLEEEMRCLLEQLEQAGHMRAELESQCSALEQQHKIAGEEKDCQILHLQKSEKELQAACEALKIQNENLLQDISHQAVQSAQTIQQLEDELHQKSKEINQFLVEPVLQKSEMASQTSSPDENSQAVKVDLEENIASLQKRVAELEEEKCTLLLSTVELEELKVENERLHSQITLLEAQRGSEMAGGEVTGQITIDEITKSSTNKSSTEESRQEDNLEIIVSQKHKLSVLLLEMKEAQEEIAFLKGQLQITKPDTNLISETFEQGEIKQAAGEGMIHEGTEQSFPLMQSEACNPIVIDVEGPENTIPQNQGSTLPEIPVVHVANTGVEMESVEESGKDSLSVAQDLILPQQDELKRLEGQILELESSLQKAEESYEKSLGEKAEEISKLAQLVENFKKNEEKNKSTLSALCDERDQLLVQVKELCVITELKAQVKQLQENLAESEKQRISDFENKTTQESLLTEQIRSLSTESKSKDLKIETLQKELDEVHLQLSDQSTLVRNLKSELQKKESKMFDLEEHIRDTSNKMEELSQTLSEKELETARIDQLLLEKTRVIETLQQAIEEKDQQVTEISVRMSEKMVQLNEEKFSLGVEVKALREKLSVLSIPEGKKEKETEEKKEECSGVQHDQDGKVVSAPLIKNEELQSELNLLKKQSDQIKRKLQAALINRKELMKKVTQLEKELAEVKNESKEKTLFCEGDGMEATQQGKDGEKNTEESVTSESQETEISLNQKMSEKELELQNVKRDLEEKVAAEEQLQALIKEMKQSLQDKLNLIDVLKAEITENQTVIQKLTTSNKDSGDGDSAIPIKETIVITTAGAESGEHWKLELEDRILNLEQEKEQLQKKLQEVLASRKVTLKKAQEKDRHHREQLKQQKDDYNLLQERFDEQSKENESIRDQLRELEIRVRESTDSGLVVDSNTQELDIPSQSMIGPTSKAKEQWPPQMTSESGWHPDWVERSGGRNELPEEDSSVELLRDQLKELQIQKEELEFRVSSTINDLSQKSEEAIKLQEQITKLLLEAEGLKVAAHEAEAQVTSMKLELESRQTEITKLEHFRELQPELDELKSLMNKKNEEVDVLHVQVKEKNEILVKVQTEIVEQEDLIRALHAQLEMQAKEYEEKIKQLQTELSEIQRKPEEVEEEAKSKQQIQRKLQAALISRKETLKESKCLKEELSLAKNNIETLTKTLADVENQVSAHCKERDVLLDRLTVLQEEKERLITEVDRSLLESQNLSSSCESLKLALEGLTEDKEKLVKEIESLKCAHVAENTEWQEKHKELQKEYEILLQSYENVSNEAERIQHVVETVRQEKQELYGKLKNTEAKKKDTEKQLQEAEQEMEEMKEKMRKFAKSKQQKILELEEENDRLRAEVHPAGSESTEPAEMLYSSPSVKEELEDTKLKYESLSKEFETLMTLKYSLSEEIQNLKQHLEETESKLRESIEGPKKHELQMDSIEVAQQATSVSVAVPVPGKVEEQVSLRTSASSEYSSSIPVEGNAMADVSANDGISSHDEINTYIQQIDQLAERIKELEEEKKMREEVDSSLEDRKDALLNQLEAKDGELKTLREEVTKINLLNEKIQHELVRVTKMKEMVEVEKDDLEERLMNQLAELNGSIGNYQQDVTDAQMRNELLESEIQNLQKCVSELEEEKRQVVKEKNRIESEIQKEYLEKLQSAQKGGQGSKTHTKELQELLKEKQQEVKQLQKDCIRYQEKISGLERTVKALEFVQNESQKELEMVKENLAQVEEDRKKAQEELDYCKVLLDDTQSEAARVLADSLKVKKELQSNKELVKSQMKQKDEDLERKLEQAEDKHMKEVKNMQEKLDALHREKVHLEETFGEVQVTLNKKDQEVKQLQENLNSTLAQLAAFTKSMSSLQDDRDRVIDEAKKWERKFSDAIQTKEEEIRAKEENCSVLKDHLRQMSIHMEELQINISRLEHDKQTWESKAQTEVQFQQKVSENLQGENKGLMSQLEESKQMYSNSQNELAKLDVEVKSLRDQLTEANNSFANCKEAKEKLEGIVKQQETDLQNCKFNCEQLEADLQASRDLTGKLHEEISTKEQKIITLLSAKEEAVLLAISELQQQHGKEVKELESQLAQKEEEKAALEDEKKKAVDKTTQLMETMKTVRKDSKQQKAQLDSFTKSMSSLQDDRDRILGDYRQLEERHLSAILEKDQLIQEAATENNKLKEEIRCLRGQMDDLNSENAKLTAEQYQRITKDYQQRQLLEIRLQRSQELENEKIELERKLKASEASREDLKRSSDALEEEKQILSKEIESLKTSVSQLKCQVAALQEGESLGDFQAQLKGGEEEVQRLGITLSLSQKKVTELEEELVRVQKEAAKKVGEIEEKLKKELKHLRHDAGIMRNETETAEERVAELASDLVEMEQSLLKVTEENKDLKAQIQAFGKSMSSLQDSRDHANEELQELKKQHAASLEEQQCHIDALKKEMTQLREEQILLSRERDDLVSKVASLESHAEDDSSLPHLEKLNQQLRSKDEELFHLSSQLEGSSNQIQSFSKAMASLQAERDHLLSELDKMRKSEEGKQWSSSQPFTSPSEVQSLKKAMSSLQNDRDRLLKELKNLQQQYLQINQENTELRPLKVQLEEYQEQTNKYQSLQEQLKQENLSCQQELQHLRVEKNTWEVQEKRVREQYLMALSDKEQQLSHLQSLVQELRSASRRPSILSEQYQRQASAEATASSESSRVLDSEIGLLKAQLNDSLKEVHQKELRIQQLNSKLSQIFEEKSSLSIQLRDSSHSLRESHQRYNDLLNHCTGLKKQIQEMQLLSKETGTPTTDAAPGAPQEKNEPQRESDPMELRELQLRFSEAQQEQCNTRQEVSHLKKLLEEERDHRLAAEEALSAAQEEIRRMELNEWPPAQNSGISDCGLHEQAILIEPVNSSFRRTRSNVGWRRILRSLCYSRTRVPLLAAVYILVLHILVLLCFTGHL
ncbi:golgin subfamily B member 1 isoform X2 [Trichosurus vulpecula]|uniref:golgin subfamily B member 1 isoform X2 n=1 Tax=Trichosurus vulpecula TaxID=9337 RepID=UPI00186B5183|nr:golgin subfamily B member 1 isoform X2 [Trichosurus vulpecula]XP_036600809.1 golgin subfamily B member 1 isoform X2 [Trichosurus vulpecula]